MPCSGYDEIAHEYYDGGHITSRNFDTATLVALAAKPFVVPDGLVLEVGAGRGRCTEFLRLPADRIVQLDNSAEMLALQPREESRLRILADACSMPLMPQQFGSVIGFLVDPFMGLKFLAEAYQMLRPDGALFLTLPTQEWGAPLRTGLGIDVMTTRFKVLGTERAIVLPSLLHSQRQLTAMLARVGFRQIEIEDHALPHGDDKVSPDITAVCKERRINFFQLPIIHTIRARR